MALLIEEDPSQRLVGGAIVHDEIVGGSAIGTSSAFRPPRHDGSDERVHPRRQQTRRQMEIVVLGATGRIGSEVVEEALGRGFTVRAATRMAVRLPIRPRLSTIRIDFDDPDRMGAAVGDSDAVIACLWPRPVNGTGVAAFSAATGRLVAAMERQRVNRLVVLSDAVLRLAGEPRLSLGAQVMSALSGARQTLAAKLVELDVITRSDRDWTALRVVRTRDGSRTGHYELGGVVPDARARISRADVAVALVDQVTDADYLRLAPFLTTRRRGE